MRRLFLGVLCIALAACGSDKTTGPSEPSFVGTYSLKTLNGSPLPYIFLQSGQTSLAVTSMQMVIADGGSWSLTTGFQTTANGQTTTDTGTNSGTWLRTGDALALYSTVNDNTPFTGSFSSNRLTLSDGSYTYVFLRN